MNNHQKIIGMGVLFLGIILAGGSSYLDYQQEKITDHEESLRELDRVNKLLGVNPSDLADPLSRRVSQQARDFVDRERIKEAEIKW